VSIFAEKSSWTVRSIVVIACIIASAAAFACDTPVYQWAMDNWQADAYELVVFHTGALTPADQGIVDGLSENSQANLSVRTIDVSRDMDEHVRSLWEAQSSPELPCMVLCYPLYAPVFVPVWTAPVTADAVQAISHSPAREDVAGHLLDGDAAVWVLLECGDAAKDEAAADTLRTELERMPESLAEAVSAIDAGDDVPVDGYAFSVVSVSRDDQAEAALVEMLLRTEPDLRDFEDPMAFPVYGRGRALYALVGAGITGQNIRQACLFLASGCSCEVKDDNPGTDLLMAVDWDAAVDAMPIEEFSLPPLPSRTAVEAAEANLAAVEEPHEGRLLSIVLAGLGAAFAVVAVATILIIRRKPSA
jgi:hypothetical protein